jgi:hypothetical protein
MDNKIEIVHFSADQKEPIKTLNYGWLRNISELRKEMLFLFQIHKKKL